MADTFERLTEPARLALRYAADEAASHHHPYIGTEHLLAGVTIVDEGPAAEALAELGLGADGAREQLVRVVGTGYPSKPARPTLTPRAKGALMGAVYEATRRAHDHVGPEHLLLGLMRDEQAVSAAMCQHLGVGPADVRRAVERRIRRN